jgi:hypothetical protein
MGWLMEKEADFSPEGGYRLVTFVLLLKIRTCATY